MNLKSTHDWSNAACEQVEDAAREFLRSGKRLAPKSIRDASDKVFEAFLSACERLENDAAFVRTLRA